MVRWTWTPIDIYFYVSLFRCFHLSTNRKMIVKDRTAFTVSSLFLFPITLLRPQWAVQWVWRCELLIEWQCNVNRSLEPWSSRLGLLELWSSGRSLHKLLCAGPEFLALFCCWPKHQKLWCPELGTQALRHNTRRQKVLCRALPEDKKTKEITWILAVFQHHCTSWTFIHTFLTIV